MNSSNTMTRRTSQPLQSTIAGDVFVPGEDGYDEARRAFDLTVDLRPSVVVLAESAVDVVWAVQFSRSLGMRIAPLGTGHGAVPLEPLEGAMLIKTSRMRRVEIDPATRIARAEAGAEWQDVTVPAAEHGLAALAGTSPNVGVTGYTLGGGIGWLARRYGLAANSVTAVELVTVDGRLARADSLHNPHLFWAVRGGGGSVGVVTALEMTLFPVRELYAGALFFPVERSSEVLHAWREWTDTVPNELTSIARILRVAPFPEVPEPMRGRAFALVEIAYIGDVLTGAELLRPLRALGPELDTCATIPAPVLQTLHMDPAQPVAGDAEGALLTDFPANAIDAVVSLAGPNARTVRRRPRARASREGRPHPVARRPRLLQLRGDPGRGTRRAPARRLSAPAGDQGPLRPRPGDHLRAPRPARRVLTRARSRSARSGGVMVYAAAIVVASDAAVMAGRAVTRPVS